MKKYNIKVNGTMYEVEVELSGESTAQTKNINNADTNKQKPQSTGDNSVLVPMSGTILDVKVSNGTNVKKGDILFILESMKMENEIVAPMDGKISSVSLKKGETVQSGAFFCNID